MDIPSTETKQKKGRVSSPNSANTNTPEQTPPELRHSAMEARQRHPHSQRRPKIPTSPKASRNLQPKTRTPPTPCEAPSRNTRPRYEVPETPDQENRQNNNNNDPGPQNHFTDQQRPQTDQNTQTSNHPFHTTNLRESKLSSMRRRNS